MGSRLDLYRLGYSLPTPFFLTPRRGETSRHQRQAPARANPAQRRIATGIDRYVLKSQTTAFFVSIKSHHQSGGRASNRNGRNPAKTLTGAHRGEKALVDASLAPFLTEHANASNQRNVGVDKPCPTITAETKRGSFALVGATMIFETFQGQADCGGCANGHGIRTG